MTRVKFVALAIVFSTIVIATVTLTKHFRLKAIPPAELALRRLAPAIPPGYSCDRITRAFDDSANIKPVLNPGPLNADEIAVYKTILQHRKSGSTSHLNLARDTYPLQGIRVSCECLNGIDVQSARNASRSYHILGRYLLVDKGVHLVGPESGRELIRANDPDNTIPTGVSIESAVRRAYEAGVFSLSEIAFDPEHRRAIVSYSFVCGGLCGNGRTLLLEKVEGVWKINEMMCGGDWIS